MARRKIPLYRKRQHQLLRKMQNAKSYKEWKKFEKQWNDAYKNAPYANLGMKAGLAAGLTGGPVPGGIVIGAGHTAEFADRIYKAYKRKHQLKKRR